MKRIVGRIAELVAAPSVSSTDPALDMGNRAVIDLLADWLDDLRFDVVIEPVDAAAGKFNLVATLGAGRGHGDGLVLAGHTDTVPYDRHGWSGDPFAADLRDGRLYGLGTADMKAFLVLAVEAASRVDAGALREPLVIVATADEESSMSGARALEASGRRLGRHVIIGEPTGLVPVYAHKGVMMEAIRLTGRSGHSSDPSLGESALEAMYRVIGELQAWRAELGARFHDDAFAVPVPTLNFGHIHGGDSPNRICGQCELHVDLRPLPGMEPGALRETLRERVTGLFTGTGIRAGFDALYDGIPAQRTDPDAAVVRAARELTGRAPVTVSFGTEAPYFSRLGAEVVVLGPGDIEVAHQPDEFVALARMAPTIALLGGFIRRFCV